MNSTAHLFAIHRSQQTGSLGPPFILTLTGVTPNDKLLHQPMTMTTMITAYKAFSRRIRRLHGERPGERRDLGLNASLIQTRTVIREPALVELAYS